VVNGKEGFYLRSELGNYLIEPQVDLGHLQGVAVPSRADFVFYPERPEPEQLPIVVFTDGYEYHADPNAGLRTGIDTAQRMALMRSGRYRVWSLTWDDVQEQFRFPVPRFEAELMSPGAKFGPLVGKLDPANAGTWKSLGGLSSFGALMLLLGAAKCSSWTSYAQAFVISLLESDPDNPGRLRLRLQRSHSDGSPLLHAEGGMEATALQERNFEALCLRLHLFDDYAHHGIIEWKKAWREFLRLGNLLQFIVRLDFVSSLGLVDQLYEPIYDWGNATRGAGPVPDRLAALLELVDAEVRDLCRKVAERRKILPEAGFELTSAQGEIVATAELAWPTCTVAVLLGHEADGAARFEADGWHLFMSDLVSGAPEPLLDLLPDEVAE
jgi:DEAD/DEAH box helicase domain-containing protein